MTTWPPQVLDRIIEADDLHVAPYRPDGTTPGTPTWIWAIEVDGELYVRAYNGPDSRWYQAAIVQRAGLIRAAAREHAVTFSPVEGPLNDAVDAAYRAKYAGSPYLPPMVTARARAATVRISPAESAA
jgi:hypothetical protein